MVRRDAAEAEIAAELDNPENLAPAPQEEQPAAPRPAPANRRETGWPLYTAVSLMKVGLQLQRELLEEKIFNFIVAWCPFNSHRACIILGLRFDEVASHREATHRLRCEPQDENVERLFMRHDPSLESGDIDRPMHADVQSF